MNHKLNIGDIVKCSYGTYKIIHLPILHYQYLGESLDIKGDS